MEATVPLRILGHLPVHTALKAVSSPHPDCTTKVFLESGLEPTWPVSP